MTKRVFQTANFSRDIALSSLNLNLINVCCLPCTSALIYKQGIMRRSEWKQKTSVLAVAAFLLFIGSCSKDDKNDNPDQPPKLGDTYQGGIVFYIDNTGKHGLIAASSDLSKSAAWWNGSFVATSANSATDGSGNTAKILLAQGNTGSYAAKLCHDYRGGNFSDWFLPSKDQLNTLYTQKTLVGGFTDDIYWSSTESAVGEAWVQDFQDGTQHTDNTSDGATVGTRAVRAF